MFRRLARRNRRLYEQFVLRNINQEEYKAAKVSLDADIGRLKRITYDFAEQVTTETLREIAQTVVKSKTLTRQLVDVLIDKVHVYPDKHIKVDWKISGFGDVLEVVGNA
ncbi:MAG: hypothetical protein LBM98_01175 [Oscillospiraceae bacterium]|nr:hypothetical protein [Oscillospiraceae bacterium]